MILKESVFTASLAQVAYMVADTDAGVAAVIDPRRDIDVYVNWARENGVQIVAVLETHVHADFVSGGSALATATGAPVYTPRLGDAEYEHIPVDDGMRISIGNAVLQAMFTPGHTPEHMSYLLYEIPGTTEPSVIYSGDSLFVGDVGRPDLLGTERTRELAKNLFDTVHNRFKQLPESVIVFPGHTAGSSCGKKIGSDPSSTIGKEKRQNYAFQFDVEETFIAEVLADMPTPPSYYPVMKQVNKVGGVPFADLSHAPMLSTNEARATLASGAFVIDMRSEDAYLNAHLTGSRFAGVNGDYLTWIGWYAPYDRQVLIIVSPETDITAVRTSMAQIGLDRIAGWFDGDPQELGATESIDSVSVDEAMRLLEAGNPLLDVRSLAEFQDDHLPGALHIPTGDVIRGAAPEDVGPGETLLVMCASGYRSAAASSVLRDAGYTRIINVLGGIEAMAGARLQHASR